jgi:hypothetical protein
MGSADNNVIFVIVCLHYLGTMITQLRKELKDGSNIQQHDTPMSPSVLQSRFFDLKKI